MVLLAQPKKVGGVLVAGTHTLLFASVIKNQLSLYRLIIFKKSFHMYFISKNNGNNL